MHFLEDQLQLTEGADDSQFDDQRPRPGSDLATCATPDSVGGSQSQFGNCVTRSAKCCDGSRAENVSP
jgi:hypothetical protein